MFLEHQYKSEKLPTAKKGLEREVSRAHHTDLRWNVYGYIL